MWKIEAFIPVRAQPPHIWHIKLFETACQKYSLVKILVTFSDEISVINPFLWDERVKMIDESLVDLWVHNYEIHQVTSFSEEESEQEIDKVISRLKIRNGKTDVISWNPRVEEKFSKRNFKVIKPQEIIPESDTIDIYWTQVREMILQWNGYEEFLPTWTKNHIQMIQERLIKLI